MTWAAYKTKKLGAHRQQSDPISLILFFQNDEMRLMMGLKMGLLGFPRTFRKIIES
jgi:hypothetical protein